MARKASLPGCTRGRKDDYDTNVSHGSDERPTLNSTMKDKLQNLMAEYGRIAVIVYISTFVITMSGFSLAIMQGFEVDGASSTAGTLGAAWLATKLTQPIRIAVTLALTPVIGAILKKRKHSSDMDV